MKRWEFRAHDWQLPRETGIPQHDDVVALLRSAEFARQFKTGALHRSASTSALTDTQWLQDLAPLSLVFEQHFAEEPDWQHAVICDLVVELLERVVCAFLGLVIVAQF